MHGGWHKGVPCARKPVNARGGLILLVRHMHLLHQAAKSLPAVQTTALTNLHQAFDLVIEVLVLTLVCEWVQQLCPLYCSIQSTASTMVVSGQVHMLHSHSVSDYVSISYKLRQKQDMMVGLTFEQESEHFQQPEPYPSLLGFGVAAEG